MKCKYPQSVTYLRLLYLLYLVKFIPYNLFYSLVWDEFFKTGII